MTNHQDLSQSFNTTLLQGVLIEAVLIKAALSVGYSAMVTKYMTSIVHKCIEQLQDGQMPCMCVFRNTAGPHSPRWGMMV